MSRSRDFARGGVPRTAIVAAVTVAVVLLSDGRAYAQAADVRGSTPAADVKLSAARPADGPSGVVRRSLATLDYASLASREQTTAPPPRRSSVGRKILGGALGAVGGFFAGGYLGAKIDGDCGGCDDPGFKGALIGAPIGAVVGGILGARFF